MNTQTFTSDQNEAGVFYRREFTEGALSCGTRVVRVVERICRAGTREVEELCVTQTALLPSAAAAWRRQLLVDGWVSA